MVKFKFLNREPQSPNEETQSPKNGKGDLNLLRLWKREIIFPMRESSLLNYKRRVEFPRRAKRRNHILNEEIQFPYKCRRRFESPNRVGHDSRILWNENHAFDPPSLVLACWKPAVLVGVHPFIFWLPWIFFILLLFIHIWWRPNVLSSWAKRWQLKSIQACKHVCQLMHKHVQARCQLKELFGSIIYSATDFLVVPKAILPRHVLSMDFCVGRLHLHHLLLASCCCCWEHGHH